MITTLTISFCLLSFISYPSPLQCWFSFLTQNWLDNPQGSNCLFSDHQWLYNYIRHFLLLGIGYTVYTCICRISKTSQESGNPESGCALARVWLIRPEVFDIDTTMAAVCDVWGDNDTVISMEMPCCEAACGLHSRLSEPPPNWANLTPNTTNRKKKDFLR